MEPLESAPIAMETEDNRLPQHHKADIPERHVVLVTPEVHWNTGNVGRTCLGANAALHLVRPLGFALDSRHLKRAGLDYWPRVDLTIWDDFEAFLTSMAPGPHELCLFTKRASRSFYRMPRTARMFLVFGAETRGLPESILSRYPRSCYHIPISGEIRSLNLSTSVGIALYESLREAPQWHGWNSLFF